jgi:hypothetical protein
LEKKGTRLPANANSRPSLVDRLDPLLGRIQKKNNNTKTKIVCSERTNHLCANTTTEVCNLTQTGLRVTLPPKWLKKAKFDFVYSSL